VETFLLAVVAVLVVVVAMLLLRPRKIEVPGMDELENKLRFALASADQVREVQEILKSLPDGLLQSIRGSLAERTGKLHELMSVFELTQYDRLFYFGGSPIDFIGIKYGETIDFIEVKSRRFQLTEDEKKLRELVESRQVKYVPLKVERIALAEEISTVDNAG